MKIEMRLLGCFSVRGDGREIPPAAFGGRLARSLVKILATRRGRFVPNDVLAEALWPERMPADTDGNLSVLVNRARRALGDPTLIATGPRGYSFVTGDRCTIDAEQFMACARATRQHLAAGETARALSEARAALRLWSGEPLADEAYEDWAQEYRSRLLRARLQVLEQGAEAALALGETVEAVELAELAVAREPLREAGHLLRVRALAASGDTAGALEAFDQFRRRLAEALGLDPSHEAMSLQARILRGEIRSPIRAPIASVSPVPAAVSTFDHLPFVGRQEELDAILTRAGKGAVVVSGPAGAGKSRLLAEVAARTPVPVISARAYLPEREQPWGLGRNLLRETLAVDPGALLGVPERAAQALADIIPEVEELRPNLQRSPIDAESRRALALEAGVLLMCAAVSRGVLVQADDLQWADATSLALLGMLSGRVPGAGIVLAYRPEEVTPTLASLLAHLTRVTHTPLTIRLQPLASEAINALVGHAGVAEAIRQETDGTPLAVEEVVRELSSAGVIERRSSGSWLPRSDRAVQLAREAGKKGKRRAILARAEQAPPPRRKILSMLALLGREGSARLVADATGAEQAEVLEDLEALARTGLARLGDKGWATAHDLITESIVDGLNRAERGRLHQMLAGALQREGAESFEVARHLAAAGDAAAAAQQFAEAARRSLDRYAAEEAERSADAGLRLEPGVRTRADLLDIRAEARFRRGDLAGARHDFREALAVMDGASDRARVLTRMALLASGSDDLVHAAELVELALVESAGNAEVRADALAVGGIVDMNAGRHQRAHERFHAALRLKEAAGDARGVANVLDCQAMQTWLEGKLVQAAEDFQRVAGLFMETGELLRLSSARASRGQILVLLDQPEEALALIDEAVAMERSLGHAEGEAYARWYRSEALTSLGRLPEAIDSACEALAIAESLGHRELTAAALNALSLAKRTAGDLPAAERFARRSLQTAGEHLPLFLAYSASELALVLVAQGALDEADGVVRKALAAGMAVGQYQARLAQAELAAARGDPAAPVVAGRALALAEAGGHRRSARRLAQLAARNHDHSA